MSYDAETDNRIAMTAALSNVIKTILEAANSNGPCRPSKLSATYEWAGGDDEALVPVINIQWFNDAGCVQK